MKVYSWSLLPAATGDLLPSGSVGTLLYSSSDFWLPASDETSELPPKLNIGFEKILEMPLNVSMALFFFC